MAVERTLSIIKPDAVAKNVIGEILARFEKAGLRIVASRMIHLSRQDAEGFYAVHRARPFFKDLVEFMISGPVMVQALEGDTVVIVADQRGEGLHIQAVRVRTGRRAGDRTEILSGILPGRRVIAGSARGSVALPAAVRLAQPRAGPAKVRTQYSRSLESTRSSSPSASRSTTQAMVGAARIHQASWSGQGEGRPPPLRGSRVPQKHGVLRVVVHDQVGITIAV